MERGPHFCVGDVHDSSKETCYATYDYKWTCTLGGGEGDFEPSDPEPEELGSLPRTGGGGTVPTIPNRKKIWTLF